MEKKYENKIVAEHLTKVYELKEKKGRSQKKTKQVIHAVQDITLEIPKGKIIGLLGINGAGKTTTIRMLSFVIEPTYGTLYMNGMDAIRYHRKMKEKINVISGGEIFKRNEAKASDCRRNKRRAEKNI